MSKYIDAEKLKERVTRLIASARQNDWPIAEDYLRRVIDIINSLQQEQPEVDLEKEYKTWWDSITGKINVEHMMEWYMHETARHFYELGLNARKEG